MSLLGIITGSCYQKGYWKYFQANYEVIKSNGMSFFPENQHSCIPYFRGAQPIDSLPLRPITDLEKEALTERGKQFAKYAIGIHYMQYEGALSRAAVSW